MSGGAPCIAVLGLAMAGCAGLVEDPSHDYASTTAPGSNTGDGGAMSSEGDGVRDGDGGRETGRDESGGKPTDNPADACRNGTETLTQGLSITQIALYQTVKIPLFANGSWNATREAPVVQGKRALVRVFVEPQAGFSSHTVRGVLTLENGQMPKYITSELAPNAASKDSFLSSTFNFNLDPADITATTRLSVALVEMSCTEKLGSVSEARHPQSGTQALHAEEIGKLRVVVVPVNIGGHVPPTDATQLVKMREALLAYYPVSDVEISADDVLNWPYELVADGGGWSDLLNELIQERRRDRVDDDIYYYGLVTPTDRLQSFCGSGCVLGIAPQATRVSPDQQVGLGVGYTSTETYDTLVHELGHAHSLGHGPCGGASRVDLGFPNTNGNTDTWGWDWRDGTIKQPTAKDIMTYCKPNWIGTYTYSTLADRCREVNRSFRIAPRIGATFRNLVLYADGSARWGSMRTTRMPGGEVERAEVLDAQGAVVGEVDVTRVRLSHSDDSLLYLPALDGSAAALRVSGHTLVLADVQAPL